MCFKKNELHIIINQSSSDLFEDLICRYDYDVIDDNHYEMIYAIPWPYNLIDDLKREIEEILHGQVEYEYQD